MCRALRTELRAPKKGVIKHVVQGSIFPATLMPPAVSVAALASAIVFLGNWEYRSEYI